MNKDHLIRNLLIGGSILCVIGAGILLHQANNQEELRPAEPKEKHPPIVKEEPFSEAVSKDEKPERELQKVFCFSLDDGEELQLPIPLSELTAAGWVLDELEGTLEADAYTWQNILKKDGKELVIQLENNSANPMPYSQCDVAKIQVSGESAANLKFSKLGLGSPLQAFIDQFGEPDHLVDNNGKQKAQYMDSPNKKFEAVFDAEGKSCEKLYFQWLSE